MVKLGLMRATICLLGMLGLVLSPAYGQGRRLESFLPDTSPLESLIRYDGAWASGERGHKVDHYEFDFAAMPGVQLRRNFNRSVITHKGAILGTAFQQDLLDVLSLEITPRTTFGFSRQVNTVRDLQELLLSGKEAKILSLTQGFGAGASSGALEFKRVESAKFSRSSDIDRLVTESLSLRSGLGKGYDVAAKLIQTDAPELFGLHQRKVEGSLGLPFMGGTGKLAYSSFQERNGIHSKQVRIFDVSTPLTLFGGEGAATYHRVATSNDGQWGSAKQTLDFTTSLDAIRQGARFTYKIEQLQRKNKPDQEVRTSVMETPWSVFGGSGGLMLNRVTVRESGKYEVGYNTRLTAQVQGAPLTVQTHRRQVVNGGSTHEEDTWTLDTPKLSLLGGTTIVEYHRAARSTLDLVASLDKIMSGSQFSYKVEQVTRKKKPDQEVRTSIWEMPWNTFGSLGDLMLKRVTVRESGKYEVGYGTRLTAQVQGAPLTVQTYNKRIADGGAGHKIDTLIVDTPKLSLWGRATVEYHINVTHNDGTKTTRPRLALAIPLDFLLDEMSLTHNISQVERKKKPTQEVRETVLALPVDIWGGTANIGHIRKSFREPNDYRIQHDSSFEVPLAGESLKLTRRAINIPTGTGVERDRRIFVDLPKFKLFTDWATITAQHLISEHSGRSDHRTTDIDIVAEPLRALKIIGNYHIRDEGGGQDSRNHRVLVSQGLGEDLSLNLLFDQANDADSLVRTVRNLYLTKDKSSESGLGIQVGYTTWNEPGEDPKSAGDARLSIGDSKHVAVTARFTEYDDKKWKRLSAPIVQVALEHGDPSRLMMKLEYEDHPERALPRRGIKLAFPALGGNMLIGYSQGPLGQDGKTVQLADMYEANLSRKLFGSVNLDMSYHYWDYDQLGQGDGTKQYLRVQLEGGEESHGGKVALGYLSGYFVPKPGDKKKVAPEALVDLSYAKAWGDAGRFMLALHRPTFADPKRQLEESLEAQLEYGNLGISYKVGAVVPRPDKKKLGPAAILSVSYEKRWRDNGWLVFTFNRTTPPQDRTNLTRSMEGRVEYSSSF